MLREIAHSLATLFLALGCAAASGCGGDSTQRGFAANADAICRGVVAEFPTGAVVEPGTATADRKTRELVEARGEAILRLSELPSSREEGASAALMLRQLRKSQRLLERAVQLGENEMVLPTLLAAAAEGKLAEAAARGLGLDTCARL